MSIDSRTETIGASGQVKLKGCNFFFMITASAPITVQLNRGGTNETFTGLQAGVQVGRVKWWDNATIIGAAGTVVTFFLGDATFREDFTLFNQQIAVISGVTAVAISPASTFVDTVDTAQATNTQTAIAANLLRRRITIGVPPSAAANEPVRVSNAGGAGRGIVIQPGTYQEFQTTAALFVRNDNTLATGLGTVWYAEEET